MGGARRGRRSPPKSSPASPHVSTSDKDVYTNQKRTRRTSGDVGSGSGPILQLPKSRSRPSLSESNSTSAPSQSKSSAKRPPRIRKGRTNKSSSLSKSPSREQSSTTFRSRRQISISSDGSAFGSHNDVSRTQQPRTRSRRSKQISSVSQTSLDRAAQSGRR